MAVPFTFPLRRATRIPFAMLAACVILPAHAQDFGEHSHKPQFPVESHPRVSDKENKAALEKIPTPKDKFDPWGAARPNEAAKNTKKPASP
jgi:hypothetical protein